MRTSSILRPTVFLASLLAIMGQASAAVDAAWFDRCQPSGGAIQGLGLGSSISFYNSDATEAAALFITVTVGPLGRVTFASRMFTAIAPDGSSARIWNAVLTHVDEKPVTAAEANDFAATGRLSNGSLGAHRYRLAMAAASDIPPQFTLVAPPVSTLWKNTETLQVQFKRFGAERFVRICGVNGLTTTDRPYRPSE
jgi:hypothetical protein